MEVSDVAFAKESPTMKRFNDWVRGIETATSRSKSTAKISKIFTMMSIGVQGKYEMDFV